MLRRHRLFFDRWLILFLAFSLSVPPQAFPGSSSPQASAHAGQRDLIRLLQPPAESGLIDEVFDSGSENIVILIEDAHAHAEAQQHIRELIDYYRRVFPGAAVAAEGAQGEFDPLFLQSFPMPEILEKVLTDYMKRGELTGPVAAAVLSRQGRFQGLEDWELYKEGYRDFLASLRDESGAAEVLDEWKAGLERRRQAYPEALREVSRAVERFQTDPGHLEELLLLLSRHARPAPGSLMEDTLAILKEENGRGAEAAAKRSAEQIRSLIERGMQPGEGRNEALSRFNSALQEFRTGRLAPGDLLLSLDKIAVSAGLTFRPDGPVLNMIDHRRRLLTMKSGRWQEELEAYESKVLDSLAANEEQRQTEYEARIYFLFSRLAALELSTAQWNELKKVLAAGHFSGFEAFIAALSARLASNRAFYLNAEKRDGVFQKKIASLLEETQQAPSFGKGRAVLCVAGGFHTSGLKEGLREKGISYAVVRPGISAMSGRDLYRSHMQGQVSWRSYFKAEGGKTNLHDAFMRAMRDSLLGAAPASKETAVEHWRAEILSRLGRSGRIREAGRYMRFLDEIPNPLSAGLESRWRQNAEAFAGRFEALRKEGRADYGNISRLLEASHMAEAPKSGALMPESWMPAAAFGLRSEIRKEGSSVIRHSISDTATANTFYLDPEKRIHFHGSVRTSGESGGGRDYTDVRALLTDGFVGFRARVDTGAADISISKYAVNAIQGTHGGLPLKGVEFEVDVQFNATPVAKRVIDIPVLEAGSGLSVRDRIRMKKGDSDASLDPKAAENISGLARLGENPFPRVSTPVAVPASVRGRSAQKIILENTIQSREHFVSVELYFPEEVTVLVHEEHGVPVIAVASNADEFKFTVRLLSSHDSLTHYAEKEIYRPEILRFRDQLKEEVLAWEEDQFRRPEKRPDEDMEAYEKRLESFERALDGYKARLRRLKKAFDRPAFAGGVYNEEIIRLNGDLLASVEAFENVLRNAGFLSGAFTGARQLLLENRFDGLVLHKYDTYNEALLMLQFLLSKEVMLAGSWQYLSYFGRDTILTARVLKDVLQPAIFQNLFQSVLDRVYAGGADEGEEITSRRLHARSEGEVAHEEDLRWPRGHKRRLDYRMMDGEFMLMTLAEDFMAMDIPDEDKTAFWTGRSLNRPDKQKDFTNLEILRKTVRYILDKAAGRSPVGMKDVEEGIGDPTGNWRDAMNSLARAMYPGDVNYEWIYSALLAVRAMQKQFVALGLPSPVPDGYEISDDLITAWEKKLGDFLVVFRSREDQAGRLLDWYRDKLRRGGNDALFALSLLASASSGGRPDLHSGMFQYWKTRILPAQPAGPVNAAGVDETAVEEVLRDFTSHFLTDERAEDFFVYPALAKDLAGENIEAVNGDHPAFASLNRELSIPEAALAISPVLRPAAYGGLLWEEAGMIFTANPLLSRKENGHPVRFQAGETVSSIWDMLDEHSYHGLVMWMSMVNLMTEGWIRQVFHFLNEAEALAEKGDEAGAAVYIRAAVNAFAAVGLIRGNVNKLGNLKGEETLQIRIDTQTGRPEAAPLMGSIESNPAQAWNGAEIRVHNALNELLERAQGSALFMEGVRRIFGDRYTDVQGLWQDARNNDAAVRRAVRQWTEKVLAGAPSLRNPPEPGRSEIRMGPVPEGRTRLDAEALEPAVLLLSPDPAIQQRVSPEDSRRSVQVLASLGTGMPALELRGALEQAITAVLVKTSASMRDDSGRQYELRADAIGRKREALLAVLKEILGDVSARFPEGISLGLRVSSLRDPVENRAMLEDYLSLFRTYLSGKTDRLILSGDAAGEISGPLRDAGFRVSTSGRIRKVLLTGIQKKFPFLLSDMEFPENPDSSVQPVGIKTVSGINPDTASLARLAQIVYGLGSALSSKDAVRSEELRGKIAAALLRNDDLDAAFQKIILPAPGGFFYINSSELELRINREVVRALESSA